MRWLLTSALILSLAGCANQEPPPKQMVSNTVAAAPAPATQPVKPYVLHLPGISGTSIIDYSLRDGLRASGFDGPFEIYDWTCKDPGIPALHNRARNLEQAQIVADMLTKQFRSHPEQPIYLVCHSGGVGPACWALERLPNDVKVACFVMLAPALSPTYDLSKALARVAGNAYCFNSQNDDLVLGTGTKMFGTIDGYRGDAAGRVGFTRPKTADAGLYAKLISKPYDSAWSRYGHVGGHMGWMGVPFVRAIVAPLMLGREASAEVLQQTSPQTLQDVLWPK